MNDQVRAAPKPYVSKMKRWQSWQQFYGAVNVVLGGASVVCSLLLAANKDGDILPDGWGVVSMSLGAALATFLVTILNAKQYNLAFERAARELEAAISLYQADPSLPVKSLAEAEVRGIGLLNSTRSAKD